MGNKLVVRNVESLACWSERIASCKSSGKNVSTWCEENGICTCGMGNNHHWVRAYLSERFYEYDPQGLGNYCPGRNNLIH